MRLGRRELSGGLAGPDAQAMVDGPVESRGIAEGVGVLRYSSVTGAPLPTSGSPGAAFTSGGPLFGPGGVRFGSDGNLYVAGETNNTVQRYDGATGVFLGDFFSPTTG